MLAEPAFLARRSASRHSAEGPATTEAGGVAGLVSIWGERREQVYLFHKSAGKQS